MALSRLVPQPYLVEINSNVPPGLVLRWDAAPDWKKALSDACADAGLQYTADWSRNLITVARTPAALAADQEAAKKLAEARAAEAAKRAAEMAHAAGVNDTADPANHRAAQGKASNKQEWTVELKDLTLANTFMRWAKQAGARLRWDATKNVMVEAPTVYTGSFEDAVAAALNSPGIVHSEYPLEVCFYPNTPPLARITRKGDSKDCK
jgi:hypothetical protein